MSEIINWLRSKPKQEEVQLIWDFTRDLESVTVSLKEIKDPKNYYEVLECLDNFSNNSGTVILNQDLTLEQLKQAALTNYEITNSQYEPYRWIIKDQFHLLADNDDDVRCLIMTDPPEQFLKNNLEIVKERFGWKG